LLYSTTDGHEITRTLNFADTDSLGTIAMGPDMLVAMATGVGASVGGMRQAPSLPPSSRLALSEFFSYAPIHRLPVTSSGRFRVAFLGKVVDSVLGQRAISFSWAISHR
jgi:hypothetical protein